jgi:hypothetical protein
MVKRGAIRNRQLAMHIRDFSGICYGKITPTDIDGFLEFGDKLYVFIEGKQIGAPVSFGQGLALARLTDACHCPPKRYAVAIIVDYHLSNEDIDYAAASVRSYRWGGQWRQPLQKDISLKTAIDRFLAISQRPSLRVVKGGA